MGRDHLGGMCQPIVKHRDCTWCSVNVVYLQISAFSLQQQRCPQLHVMHSAFAAIEVVMQRAAKLLSAVLFWRWHWWAGLKGVVSLSSWIICWIWKDEADAWFSVVAVSALSRYCWFDTVGYRTGRASGLMQLSSKVACHFAGPIKNWSNSKYALSVKSVCVYVHFSNIHGPWDEAVVRQ